MRCSSRQGGDIAEPPIARASDDVEAGAFVGRGGAEDCAAKAEQIALRKIHLVAPRANPAVAQYAPIVADLGVSSCVIAVGGGVEEANEVQS